MVLRDDITMENIANDVSTLYTVLFHSSYLLIYSLTVLIVLEPPAVQISLAKNAMNQGNDCPGYGKKTNPIELTTKSAKLYLLRIVMLQGF